MLLNAPTSFGWGTILLHWITAALILGLIVLGFVMTLSTIDPALQFSLYQWHKSFGLVALALGALRIVWRLINRQPEPVPGLTSTDRWASHAVHYTLILLATVLPLTGWALASTSTLGIPTVLFNSTLMPDLPLARSAAAEAGWTAAHQYLAYGLLALVALHAGAAFYHHYVRHDAVLLRMLSTAGLARKKP